MDLEMHQALTAAEIEHVKKITNTGELYYDYDPLIEQARNHAFYVCRQFNQTFTPNGQGKMQLMATLFGDLGTHAEIGKGFITEFGFNLHVGDHFYARQNLKVIDCNVIQIGDYVQVGDNCGIYTSNHAFDPQKRADHWCSDHPITIGSHVSIENDVTILPGITIGDNTVIRSGSVVTHDLPANVVAAGAPCTVIENLSDKAE
ncbi:sugar O-acetyltransferase [Ligilactobacillus aviarius]|uniref:sugar O-acetyltransferase n=1 Tax=Ligilactobacillus aviarius TaxID=1606 RepID=UPI0024BBB139|nr:sugar O-acetyltransferase [Ligilactobacillus aviarius]